MRLPPPSICHCADACKHASVYPTLPRGPIATGTGLSNVSYTCFLGVLASTSIPRQGVTAQRSGWGECARRMKACRYVAAAPPHTHPDGFMFAGHAHGLQLRYFRTQNYQGFLSPLSFKKADVLLLAQKKPPAFPVKAKVNHGVRVREVNPGQEFLKYLLIPSPSPRGLCAAGFIFQLFLKDLKLLSLTIVKKTILLCFLIFSQRKC